MQHLNQHCRHNRNCNNYLVDLIWWQEKALNLWRKESYQRVIISRVDKKVVNIGLNKNKNHSVAWIEFQSHIMSDNSTSFLTSHVSSTQFQNKKNKTFSKSWVSSCLHLKRRRNKKTWVSRPRSRTCTKRSVASRKVPVPVKLPRCSSYRTNLVGWTQKRSKKDEQKESWMY